MNHSEAPSFAEALGVMPGMMPGLTGATAGDAGVAAVPGVDMTAGRPRLWDVRRGGGQREVPNLPGVGYVHVGYHGYTWGYSMVMLPTNGLQAWLLTISKHQTPGAISTVVNDPHGDQHLPKWQ